jgi:hypothetical protein
MFHGCCQPTEVSPIAYTLPAGVLSGLFHATGAAAAGAAPANAAHLLSVSKRCAMHSSVFAHPTLHTVVKLRVLCKEVVLCVQCQLCQHAELNQPLNIVAPTANIDSCGCLSGVSIHAR